jgi:hypothetical protein
MTVADAADRFAILCLKGRHGQNVREQREAYRQQAEQAGPGRLDQLHTLHGLMWTLEDMISSESDLATIGAFYLALRWLNSKRVQVKNAIAESLGEPTEEKTY